MKFIEERFPVERKLLFEFTESEVTALNTFLPDLVDRTRGVVLDYTKDESRVVPTEHTLQLLDGIVRGMSRWDKDTNGHDYDDWWTNEERPTKYSRTCQR